MNTLSVKDIIKKVRAKIDEIAVNESEMIDTVEDNANLDSVIRSCIAEAYRYVSINADRTLLEGKNLASPGMVIGSDLVGRIMLPSDFLRLLNVRLSSWNSSPAEIVDETSPIYRMQSNQWVCGNPKRPVAAVVYTMTGRQLELYKASSTNDSLKSLTYIPSLADGFESVSISVQTTDAFIYYVAALVMVTFREDVAANFFSIARNLLGLE